MKRLSLVVPNLLMWDGSRPVVGGVERFTWELLATARDLGYAVDVHQNADHDWLQEVDGVRIHGHGLARLSLRAALQSIHQSTERCLYVSILHEPWAIRPGSVVVSHGVWWDGKGRDRRTAMAACEAALKQAAIVVSVDYNFQNVLRAFDPELAEKIVVIPNFVDTERFSPGEWEERPTTVLFPRRLAPERGAGLFLAALAPLLSDYADLTCAMAVDQNLAGVPEQLVKELSAPPFDGRVQVEHVALEDMPDVYRRHAIVVIPSLYSEGTSFSCLEAMASGCAVVATDVGGLTNLILSGYNGMLVPPRPEALRDALRRLIEDPAYRLQLGRNARQSVAAFSLPRWREAWRGVLLSVYGPAEAD